MCGIAGIVTKDGAPPKEEDVAYMTDVLAHRGPDGRGVWIHQGVGLGHRRLAVVDLSDRGAQPMHSKDGRYTIAFNGEIYNYKELKKELESKGVRFYSDSDTEVLLEMYRAYGSDCVIRLRGMFAFVIWDADSRSLFFARDRVGKKPFFYRILSDGSFAFASEICALRHLAPVTPDPSAIRLYFGLQYIPSPMTGFREIASLEPGMFGIFNANDFRLTKYHVWDATVSREVGDSSNRIRELLDESVKMRMRADVSVGAFLSGGIDSTAIVGIARQYTDRPIRTFTMGFPSMTMDERKEARMTAERFGTDHQEFEAKPEDLMRMTQEIILKYGGPYADSSALPVMLLAKEVSKEIKVVLVGDGGDELFGGYRRYQAYRRALDIIRVPMTRRLVILTMRQISSAFHDPRFTRMADTVAVTAKDINRGYAELFCGSYLGTDAASRLLQPDFLAQQANHDPVQFIADRMGESGHPMERAMKFDFESYLADDLNVKMDRATMAYGLEARAPLLDQNLAEYALKLPLSERTGKRVLKRACADILSQDVINRPKKGFQVPLAEWFRGPLADFWKDRCLDPRSPIATYVRQDELARLFEENRLGADHGNRLWMMLALAIWLEEVSE
jgi:asparagine synthase (glutamine-hydrolysing)